MYDETMVKPTETILNRHIELRETRGGVAKPFIVGTRIGVDTVYICHELQGMTPDEILEAYPHLSLADVHAALAYFYDDPDAIREQVKQAQAFSDEQEAKQGPTSYAKLRDALFGVTSGGNGNPVSS